MSFRCEICKNTIMRQSTCVTCEAHKLRDTTMAMLERENAELRAKLDAAVAAEREACIEIISTYRVQVGNSPAGEMACEWTMRALREIVDEIKARSNAQGVRLAESESGPATS